MSWLAVTATVDARWAEVFSDALLWAGAQSAAIEGPEGEAPRVSALLAQQVEPAAIVAAAAAHCGLVPVPHFIVEALDDDDWVRRTQAQFSPLELERVWIGATWHAAPASAKAVVRLDPGLAFGTGSHPTTRLMLAYLEREMRGGESLLDYGCGSGILAIAAAKLGAARLAAVDVDAQAVATARENAERNSVALTACAPDALEPGVYDMVLSNILAQPLIVLAPLLAARTAPHGRLALAGLLAAQAEEVAAAYRPTFQLVVAERADDWVLLAGRRK
ncbi:MAG TPA: 50S ribosomal protein L11 methyltransferase [Burkholderiales bacterium]|jgi:ribosomal protein L11 methyltransferase|nr:50S ribosomal protein L11 methyltransferase [Burkholderiales bacterium]